MNEQEQETVQGQSLWFVKRKDGSVARGCNEWPASLRISPAFLVGGDYPKDIVHIDDEGVEITFTCVNGCGTYHVSSDDPEIYVLIVGTSFEVS